MPNLDMPLARVFDGVTLKVDRIRMSCYSRLTDGSVSVNVYATNPSIMLYMLERMTAGSYHHVFGPVSISAFISQTANRAMVNCRVSPKRLSTTVIGDGVLIENTNEATDGFHNLKIEFLLKVYAFQNWDAGQIQHITFNNTTGDHYKFGKHVNELKDRLIGLTLLGPENMQNPVVLVNVEIEERVNNARVGARNQDQAVDNEEFVRVNIGMFNNQMVLDPNTTLVILNEGEENNNAGGHMQA
ncbi:hypothetical protein INT46_001897 [Mucor plumbeus]|uniref:Uncharacterized protein n=1 Tax=Mucor plumbeus TaxID=97098 RepID=A0A8H7QCD3_9FUNG|nr:hypothetical protein INT46_001897 [Mucor plumbeus]